MTIRAAVPTFRPKLTVERVLLAGILLYLVAGRILPSWTASAEEPGQQVQAVTQPVTTFTYQGRLEVDGVPANGAYDIKFVLWDAETDGSIKGIIDGEQVPITNGTFSWQLDYGLVAFDGSPRWLEVFVRPDGEGPFESMDRQELTATPYAIVAATLALPSWNETEATSAALSVENGGAGPQAYGIRGVGGADSSGIYGNGGTNGVVGETSNTNASGVYGFNSAAFGGYGVSGRVLGEGAGVYGEAGTGGIGVRGEGIGLYAVGVVGLNESPSGRGVVGYGQTGINGQSYGTLCDCIGVLGNLAKIGVRGIGATNGVEGQTNSATGYGVYGENTSTGYGVYGKSTSGDGTWGEALLAGKSGIVGQAAGGANSNFAAYFIGNVEVLGTVTASTKLFKIDHPLDPAGKWLYHTALESPDMKNLYDGVITTGADGFATVQLPDYFEALNRDFRYQLTVIGGDTWARARMASEVDGNAFVIETDQPNVTVSWQVTGIRHDAYADAHRTEVEVAKTGDELGTCIEPTACPAP